MLLLTGVRASAAQNAPVNTICSQCGSVLASGEHTCSFCEFPEGLSLTQDCAVRSDNPPAREVVREEWRGEVNQRLQAYRARRRKIFSNEAQSALPFDDRQTPPSAPIAVQEAHAVEDRSPEDDFAFTVAIGRIARSEAADARLLIDISVPPQSEAPEQDSIPETLPAVHNGLYPAASLEDRRRALLIDAACLAFAYGGFLALFGSLGGHFAMSKLSAAICFFTFAFVYLQYFGLFTIFGGTTPGMMVCGLQVASVTGDQPTPRQYLLRAMGYILSAGTFFLGFLWVLWDEDGLTWHDRLSQTYLTKTDLVGEEDISQPVVTP